MYRIDANSKFHDYEPDALPERLDSLTEFANRLGFRSIQDAALADAELSSTDKGSRERLLAFAEAGCREKLIDVFNLHCGNLERGEDKQLLPTKVYESEFEQLRKLDVLNIKLQEWSTAHFESFNFATIHAEMQERAPNLVRLVDTLAMPTSKNQGKANLTLHRQQRHVVMILSQLTNVRNNTSNFIQCIFALYLFASKLPKRVLTTLNHIGMSVGYTTLRTFLKCAADDALRRLSQLSSSGDAFVIVFDNLTKHSKVRDRRILHDHIYLNFTAGYILVPPPSRRQKMHSLKDFRRDEINNLNLSHILPTPEHERIMRADMLFMLGSFYKRCLEKFEPLRVATPPDYRRPEVFQIGTSEVPQIMPLPTYDLNEGVVNDVIKILYKIQTDVGLSPEQRLLVLLMIQGDFMTVRNVRYSLLASTTHFDRSAMFRQAEASNDMNLQYIQTSTGLFHLYMAAVQLVFKTHAGKADDRWSLERWIKVLERDGERIRSTLAKDHNACADFLDTVLDGCLLATICRSLFPGCTTTTVFPNNIGTKTAETIDTELKKLHHFLSHFEMVAVMREEPLANRNVDLENMILFMQHALMLRSFYGAMRQGDSGRIMNCLVYFTVWFQDTGHFNYASETIRLTACLRLLWSDDLRRFWMETCLLTTTDKAGSFMALDEFNEYIVREVKNMIATNVTPATDNHVRNVLSPLITVFWDVRRKVAEETQANIFDFHSSKVDTWRDNTVLANYILQASFLPGDWVSDGGDKKSPVKDLFNNGQTKLSTTEPITKLRTALIEGDGSDWEDDSDMGGEGEDESHCLKDSDNDDENE